MFGMSVTGCLIISAAAEDALRAAFVRLFLAVAV